MNTVQKGNTGDEWEAEMRLLDLAMARHAQVCYPCGAGHAYGGPIPRGYAERVLDAAADCNRLGGIFHHTWEIQIKSTYLGIGAATKSGGPRLTGVKLTEAARRTLFRAAKQQQEQKGPPPGAPVLEALWGVMKKAYGNWNAKKCIQRLFPLPYATRPLLPAAATPVRAIPYSQRKQLAARHEAALANDPYRALGVEPTVH